MATVISLTLGGSLVLVWTSGARLYRTSAHSLSAIASASRAASRFWGRQPCYSLGGRRLRFPEFLGVPLRNAPRLHSPCPLVVTHFDDSTGQIPSKPRHLADSFSGGAEDRSNAL